MVKVEITQELKKEIYNIFGKTKALEIALLFKTLEENPKKGKELSNVGNIVVKELKYEGFRFYFITDGYKIKFYDLNGLKDLVLKFVRMSKKKDQQKTIEEIKVLLKKLGYGGFK
ncbi:MAG: hypothetical protein ACOCXG_05740 [Nanoarchaeota archaeon]